MQSTAETSTTESLSRRFRRVRPTLQAIAAGLTSIWIAIQIIRWVAGL